MVRLKTLTAGVKFSMNPTDLIKKYYTPSTPLYETLIVHSEKVREMALRCARRRCLDIDIDFVAEAAMLHDIGILHCNAPEIYCTGPLPYICHGIEGKRILDAEGFPKHALVCERHTGSGLTIEDIKNQNLPLPHHDMIPISIEEKLICYADKFFSKSGDINKEKSLDTVIHSMERHGADSLARFLELHRLFG